ncbi:MAG TPA: hypothetical protein VMP11_13765 [Verrucomicrobiae bacterium]|nr:hypothetical protein [Verrucomicrobiae bacterium]
MIEAARRYRIALAAIVLATWFFYLAIGLYYATRLIPSNKASLHLTGEAYLSSFPTWGTVRETDSAIANRTAIEILKTGVPRTISGRLFLHSPVYSYFVAACYVVGGLRLLSIAVPQAALGGLICLVLAVTAYKIAPAHRRLAAFSAAILVLTNVRLAMYVAYIIPTIPLMFFLALALFYATRLDTVRGSTGFTLTMILGTYTQAVFFVAALSAALWLLVSSWKHKRRAPLIGALCIVVFAILKVASGLIDSPTASYDFQHVGDRSMAWNANNPEYESFTWRSWWEWQHKQPPTEEQTSRYNDYLARSHNQPMRAVLLWISENPATYVTLCFVRLKSELGPFTGQMSPRNQLISSAVWLLIFPAGFWGLWKHRGHALAQLAVAIILAVVAFGILVTEEPYLRYRMPVDLVLTLFAGLAYAEWLTHLRGPIQSASASSSQ